jgi:ectoine hydroxylase
MNLTPEQVEQYRQDGYLLLPSLFSAQELDVLRSEVRAEFAEESDRKVQEKGSATVRSVYGSHLKNDVFKRLSRLPRLVGPASQLLDGDDVYIYQFKINAKVAFEGDLWQWHQDYIFWLKEDGLPQPRAINVVVYFDEVNEFNGPLLFIPGSQQEGVIDPSATSGRPAGYEDKPDWVSDLTADLKFTIHRSTLERLVKKHQIVAPKGPAGSVLLFHPNVVHGSTQNMSPFDRTLTIVTYSSIGNVPQNVVRPDFLVSRDYSAVVPLPQDALLG